ncbi:MAG: thiol reductase thioredoxin [Ruminiclostridium sp.]|nr:thiol reductase thioredoxin [Ruminiclostridium sp.]
MAERITAADFGSKVLSAREPVLVEFYSDSCVPCKMLSPVLSQLESELDGKLGIYKVNAGYEPGLVEQYDVQASPTLIFFSEGREISRLRGMTKKEALMTEYERIKETKA